MTIKWVQQDPLVLNGEPFCYGSRLTVRQLLELRSNGYDLTRILKDHPELRVLGIAAAYVYAANDRAATRTSSRRTGRSPGPATRRRRRPGCRRSTASRAWSSSRELTPPDPSGGYPRP